MGAGLLKIDIDCGMCAVSRCSGVSENSAAATRPEGVRDDHKVKKTIR